MPLPPGAASTSSGPRSASASLKLWWPATAGLTGADLVKARLDALKIRLSIGVGSGGVVALYLAWRRQHSTEADLDNRERALAQQYEVPAHQQAVAATTQAHQERVADDAHADATARRITELYLKAAELLGSDKAPVRLSALYRGPLDIDLTGAHLVDFVMSGTCVGSSRFDNATFTGRTFSIKQPSCTPLGSNWRPSLTTLRLPRRLSVTVPGSSGGRIGFPKATFGGDTTFDHTTFNAFDQMTLSDDSSFSGTTFVRAPTFDEARVNGEPFHPNFTSKDSGNSGQAD